MSGVPENILFFRADSLHSFVNLSGIEISRILCQSHDRLVTAAQVSSAFRFNRFFKSIASNILVLLHNNTKLQPAFVSKNLSKDTLVSSPSVLASVEESLCIRFGFVFVDLVNAFLSLALKNSDQKMLKIVYFNIKALDSRGEIEP